MIRGRAAHLAGVAHHIYDFADPAWRPEVDPADLAEGVMALKKVPLPLHLTREIKHRSVPHLRLAR